MKYITRNFPERYFIGVEYEGGITPGSTPNIGDLWTDFLGEDIQLIQEEDVVLQYIGLECYPPDFMETKTFDYYALVQTKQKVEQPGFVTKKLPAGAYISFEVNMDSIMHHIQQVYNYVKTNNIPVHYGFDFEEYLVTEDYTKPGATLYFSMLLEQPFETK